MLAVVRAWLLGFFCPFLPSSCSVLLRLYLALFCECGVASPVVGGHYCGGPDGLRWTKVDTVATHTVDAHPAQVPAYSPPPRTCSKCRHCGNTAPSLTPIN